MGRVYLRDEVEQLLRDRFRRYEGEMQDPENLSELIRLIVADADRARRLEDKIAENATT